MKHLISLIAFLILTPSISNCQFGDVQKESENLYLLCKIWGHLKYFHPELQTCNIDWDQALIETLQAMDGVAQSEVNTLVEQLIEKSGAIPSGDGSLIPEIPTDEKLSNLDLSWFEDPNLSSSITESLKQLNQYSRPNPHCQLEGSPYASFMKFTNENNYDELGSYPDKYYRVLAMFRYWTVIDFFFPYKHLMDQDWKTTFFQNIHDVVYAENEVAYMLSLLHLTTYINDSHSFFNSAVYWQWRGQELNPYRVSFIDNKTIISEAHESIKDLEAGDVLISKNGIPFPEIRDSLRQYMGGSNQDAIERRINSLQFLATPEDFTIEIERQDGTIKSIAISPDREAYTDFLFPEETSPAWSTITTDCAEYGYIDYGILEREQIDQMVKDLWNHDILILDLRRYPNISFGDLRKHFFNEENVFHLFANPSDEYAGLFNWYNGSLGTEHNDPIFEGQVLILINEQTQSAGEFHAMGYENYPNAIKIGSPTAGADGDIADLYVPGQIHINFSSLGIYYPDESVTQRIGITPDIEVRPTIEGIRESRDELLEAALDCKLVEMGTASINLNKGPSFTVSPNPFHDFIDINHTSKHNTSVSIYNALGYEVLSTTSQSNHQINTEELASGIYFIELLTKESRTTQTIIKY